MIAFCRDRRIVNKQILNICTYYDIGTVAVLKIVFSVYLKCVTDDIATTCRIYKNRLYYR